MIPKWKYTALRDEGILLSGIMEAPNKASVEKYLLSSGVIPLHIQLMRRNLITPLQFCGISRKQRSSMLREISTLLGAGLDLDATLTFVCENTTSRKVKSVSAQLRSAVRDGTTLANAMMQCSNIFPQLVIGLVQAGEVSGTLAYNLERIASLAETEQALRTSFYSAMIYPLFVAGSALITLYIIFTQIFPLFLPLFEENRTAIPPSTILLMEFANFLLNYGQLALLSTLTGACLIHIILYHPSLRYYSHWLILRTPVICKIHAELIAAQLCRTLGTMLQSGIALVPALYITKGAITNLAAAAAFESAINAVKGGDRLAESLSKEHIFPARTIILIRLGEETAQLSKTMLHAADLHEETTRVISQRIITMLVPFITIALGILIAWIVSSVMLTVLSLNELAK